MKKYRVFIEGRNFLIAGPRGDEKAGFYTARFLEAPDEKAAEQMAIEQLRARQALHDLVRNTEEDPPVMSVTQIDEIEAFEGRMSPGDQGLIWHVQTDGPVRWYARESPMRRILAISGVVAFFATGAGLAVWAFANFELGQPWLVRVLLASAVGGIGAWFLFFLIGNLVKLLRRGR